MKKDLVCQLNFGRMLVTNDMSGFVAHDLSGLELDRLKKPRGAFLYCKWTVSRYSRLDRGLIIIPPFGSRCSVTSNYESTIPF